MLSGNKISSRGAKDILLVMHTDESPLKIATDKSLLQQSDEGALTIMLQEIIAENPTVVVDYKAGKQAAFQFFVGQAMKKSKGSANPGVVQNLLKTLLQ